MKISLIILFVLSVPFAHAQTTQKIGHADWDYIFSQMTEYKKIETDLKSFGNQLQEQIRVKSHELEAKYKSYQDLPASTAEAIKKDKETELAFLQENLQKFQQEAQASIQKKQQDLVNPVFAKVGKAIEAVAIENGFSYIINPQMIGGGDILLYADERYNISDLVLKKLGITVSKPTANKVKDPKTTD